MEKIRIGIIGCGGMNTNHERAFLTLKDDVEVTCACDIIKERAEKTAGLLNAKYAFTDYKDMVDHVDAVLVVLPHHIHYEVGMFFIQNGKHVLMEKPMCKTEEECVNLIKAAEEKNVKLMTAYPVRYWPEILKLKEYVDSGIIGDVFNMSIWTEQHTHMTEWGCKADTLGGGQFFSHGCHYVDILLRFLGNPVSGTHFGTRVGTPWMIKEGTSIASFKFENGALGYHGATWGARGTMLGALNMQVHTEKGMLEMTRGEVRLYDELEKHIPGQEADCSYKVLFKTEGFNGKHTNFEIEHFADCVMNGKTPMTSARSALQSLRIIWKMYETEKNGTIADLRGMGIANI